MRVLAFLIAALLGSAQVLAAEMSASERQALESIPQKFSAAWARASGEELGALMSEQTDFITVGGLWLHGRRDFATYHSRLLKDRFRGSSITPLEVRVQPVRDDLAFVRWSWRIVGDRNADGTDRPPRVGLMSMLAEKQGGQWMVIASQNTNGGPGTAPERVGLTPRGTGPRTIPTMEADLFAERRE